MVAPVARRAVLTGALASTLAGLAGCGSASDPSPPTGVDQLVIPTPGPDPADFVDEVTNPWLPLAVGATWEYDDAPPTELTAGPGVERDGVATTALSSYRGSGTTPVVDHVAQDREGNVWWFGRQDADADDVQWFVAPGLLMPAEPRRGDGFVMAEAPGLAVRARVLDVDASVEVPAGRYEGVVVLEVVTDAGTSTVGSSIRRDRYARGVGLVQTDETGLVAYDEPRPG